MSGTLQQSVHGLSTEQFNYTSVDYFLFVKRTVSFPLLINNSVAP